MTVDDRRAHIQRVSFRMALLVYLVVGGAGPWICWLALHDAQWVEIFSAVWWAPAGVFAWWVRYHVETYLWHKHSVSRH